MQGIRRIAIGGDFIFVMTCEACPEQYDVYNVNDLENIVGYVRLRHGYLRADYPDCGGETIYEADIDGPGGTFNNEEERIAHLTLIKLEIEKRLGVGKEE